MTPPPPLVVDSYRDGLLDLDDLCALGLLDQEEMVALWRQPRHAVAWLLALAVGD